MFFPFRAIVHGVKGNFYKTMNTSAKEATQVVREEEDCIASIVTLDNQKGFIL